MKKIAVRVVIGLVVLLVVVAAVGMLLPRGVHLERSVAIDAPRSVVFGLVNDLTRWPDWTPWNKERDPTVVLAFEKEQGEGASYSWKGDELGTGRLVITESDPQQGVKCDLFFYGEETPSHCALILDEEGETTKVVWTFDGDMGANPVGRYFGLMMESMLGPEYEEGLSNLKTLAESEATAPAKLDDLGESGDAVDAEEPGA